MKVICINYGNQVNNSIEINKALLPDDASQYMGMDEN